MPDFASFPRSLAERVKPARLGQVPALIAHPDWRTPAPVVFWMHGRTVSKEIDSGRYLRLIRAGIAVCAIDLPGHGERLDVEMHQPRKTLDLLSRAVEEVDGAIAALSAWPELDVSRLGVGGMSAGGMVTLRRLCDPHRFACASVEASTGWLQGLYLPQAEGMASVTRAPWAVAQDAARVKELDPIERLGTFRPIPLQVLHSEADAVVPFAGMKHFVDALGEEYARQGAARELIEVKTWPSTGAPQEHAGFGKVANEAKNMQVAFFTRSLSPSPPTEEF